MRNTDRRAALALLLAATLFAAVLLTLALANPAAAAVDVGAPGDAFHLANFYRAESGAGASFRWAAPGARLLLPAAYDGPLALQLRLSLPPGADPAALLRFVRDGATVAELRPAQTPRVFRLLLPPDAAPEPHWLRLEPLGLAAAPTYVPGDPRPLTFALDSFAVEAAPRAAPPLGPIGVRAALLAGALLLAWAGLVLARALPWGGEPGAGREQSGDGGEPFSAPSVGFAASARRALGAGSSSAALIAVAGAGMALWAWRDPPGFAWAVPVPPVGALAAGLALAVLVRLAPQGARLAVRLRLLTAFGALLLAWALLSDFAALAGLGAVILLLLPGALTALVLFPEQDDPATVVCIGLCGGVAVGALLLLALHALPGPLSRQFVIPVASVLTVAVIALGEWDDPRAGRWFRPDLQPPGRPAGWTGRLLALALLVALGLRLWHLGSAEFQGDEARAMLLAAAVARGDDGALLTHTKGPVEALLPAAPLTIAGTGVEWAARLPFALASLGALAGAIAILRAIINAPAAQPAALNHRTSTLLTVALLAVDGFAIGFGRIVQYQSVVMLMMAGAFWCCWRFHQGAEHPMRHLVAAAALLAVGILAHYDAGMVAPALAWLVVAGGIRRGWSAGAFARRLAIPVGVGAALLASFFLPYVLSPAFAETAAYLAGRAGEGDAGGPPFNNLPLYLAILSFYNAPPLVPLLVVAVLGTVVALLVRYVRPIPLGVTLGVALGVAALLQWLVPGAYALPGGGNWAGLAFGLPLLGLCVSGGVPAHVRAVTIWFAVALGANAFLIAEPRTHFYAAHIPAVLLVALAVGGSRAPDGEVARRRPPFNVLHAAFCALAVVVLAGGALYAQLAFLRQFPEFQRAYPAARPAVLRARFGDTLPEAGYFGFPHRDGWKAVAELYRRGELRGSYDTNQNRWLVGWYLRGLAAQCKGRPDLYLIAEAEPTVYYPPEYVLVAEVFVGPARTLAIYGPRAPDGGPRSYQLEALAAAFDARPVSPFPVMALLAEGVPRCDQR